MKKLMVTGMAVVLFISPVWAKPKFKGLIQTEGFSAFHWRQIVYPGGSSIYAEMDYGKFGLAFFQYSVWEEKNWSKITNDELDFFLLYKHTGSLAELTFVATQYNLPSNTGKKWGYSYELGFIIYFAGGELSPTFEYYRDINRFKASYLALTISHELCGGIEGSLGVGRNGGMWTEESESISGVNITLAKKINILGVEIKTVLSDLYNRKNSLGFVVKLVKEF